jgi:hypothetical protein
MTTIVSKVLIPSKFALSVAEIQYTASGTRTIIDKMTATNNATVPVTFSCWLVPSGGSAGTSEARLINQRELASKQTWTCPEIAGHTLEPNDSIVTLASAGASITIRASGREIT